MNTYKRHRFPPDIISYAVWLYYRFNLSHRDIEALPSGLRVAFPLVAVFATGCRGAAGARVRGTKRCGAVAAGRGRRRGWGLIRTDTRWQGYLESIAGCEWVGGGFD